MKRLLLTLPLVAVLTLAAGCGFFEAFTTDPDGPSGAQKSPASELAEAAGHATLDYAGLAALLLTAGKTVGRTLVAMKKKRSAKGSM